MRISIRALLCCILSTAALSAESPRQVTVHISGYVNKPGTYTVSSTVTHEELKTVCGGWTEFTSVRRLAIVRFARKATTTTAQMGITDREKHEVFYPKFDEPLKLEEGDLIFLPMKEPIGR